MKMKTPMLLLIVVAVSACGGLQKTEYAGVDAKRVPGSLESCAKPDGTFDFDDSYCRNSILDEFVDAAGNSVAAPVGYPYGYHDTVWTDRIQKPIPIVGIFYRGEGERVRCGGGPESGYVWTSSCYVQFYKAVILAPVCEGNMDYVFLRGTNMVAGESQYAQHYKADQHYKRTCWDDLAWELGHADGCSWAEHRCAGAARYDRSELEWLVELNAEQVYEMTPSEIRSLDQLGY